MKANQISALRYAQVNVRVGGDIMDEVPGLIRKRRDENRRISRCPEADAVLAILYCILDDPSETERAQRTKQQAKKENPCWNQLPHHTPSGNGSRKPNERAHYSHHLAKMSRRISNNARRGGGHLGLQEV